MKKVETFKITLKQALNIPVVVRSLFMKEGLFYKGKNPNFKYKLINKQYPFGFFEVYDDEKSLDTYLNISLFDVH